MKSIKTTITFFSLIIALTATACAGKKETNNANVQEEKTEAKVTPLTQADFLKKVYNYEANKNEWKFEGNRPVIVDFYATWCGPCKVIAPILEELSKEYDGKIDVYKVDVDKEEGIARAFEISSIPTLLFIPMKGEPKVLQGAMPKDQLKKLIDDFLLNGK